MQKQSARGFRAFVCSCTCPCLQIQLVFCVEGGVLYVDRAVLYKSNGLIFVLLFNNDKLTIIFTNFVQVHIDVCVHLYEQACSHTSYICMYMFTFYVHVHVYFDVHEMFLFMYFIPVHVHELIIVRFFRRTQ
jgi:hypothetical protein